MLDKFHMMNLREIYLNFSNHNYVERYATCT